MRLAERWGSRDNETSRMLWGAVRGPCSSDPFIVVLRRSLARSIAFTSPMWPTQSVARQPRLSFELHTPGNSHIVAVSPASLNDQNCSAAECCMYIMQPASFLLRDAMHRADYAIARCLSVRLSVRLTVCLSHADILSKGLNSNFFRRRVACTPF